MICNNFTLFGVMTSILAFLSYRKLAISEAGPAQPTGWATSFLLLTEWTEYKFSFMSLCILMIFFIEKMSQDRCEIRLANADCHWLPPNWERAYDQSCDRYFYVDHNTKETTWLNPVDKFSKPKSQAECRGDELPYGWEKIEDPIYGTYYSDHLTRRNQSMNPVSDWQRRMNILNQHHYSNSHHILSMEQSNNSFNQTRNPTTISSSRTTSTNVIKPVAKSSGNLDLYGSNSSNQVYSKSSDFDASLLDIMDNWFGRDSVRSFDV